MASDDWPPSLDEYKGGQRVSYEFCPRCGHATQGTGETGTVFCSNCGIYWDEVNKEEVGHAI